MAYQVLARKWRPASFDALVGQEHVLQALSHALDTGRLHHAYLFTGTRGVGKTTIARILARALNCDKGVSSTPCGECSSCVEIAEGRSVDLIEVDAASRTKVEDTRELLENVQYAPTRSRFKIYLIDEVHMLSGHSFNALLKTLEEPPEHVKFLLATTDPQKLPATVLSRCLQFNLKNLSAERVVGHLRHVLDAEGVAADDAALWLLGRAAQGSMRDALSLTDQAIAFGSGELREAEVATMLGSVDRSHVFTLLDAVVAGDGANTLDACAAMAEQGADFSDAVDELASVLHRLAVAQVVPSAVSREFGDAERIVELAARMTAEDVQLFYQLAVQGSGAVSDAPDPRAAFEMLALRLLAFRPLEVLDPSLSTDDIGSVAGDADEVGGGAKKPEPPSAATVDRSAALDVAPVPRDQPEPESAPASPAASESAPEPESAPESMPVATSGVAQQRDSVPTPSGPSPSASSPPEPSSSGSSPGPQAPAVNSPAAPVDDGAPWHEILATLGLNGSAYNIASHCELRSREGQRWELLLAQDQATLFNDRHRSLMERALNARLGSPVELSIEIGVTTGETPAHRHRRLAAERLVQAEAAIKADPKVQRLGEDFGAEVVEGSVSVTDTGKLELTVNQAETR